MKNNGLLIVMSGFSGCGKGTVMKRLLENYPDQYTVSVSATTRSPRPEDQDGVTYFFKSRDEFEQMISRDAFLEYAEYVGNYYGTPREYVQRNLDRGINVFLEIEVQGALKVKKAFPETTLIFIVPPDIKELVSRLEGRHTETAETIRSRMEQASVEVRSIEQYDYIVVNDEVEACVEKVHGVVTSIRERADRNQDMIARLETELNMYLKGENS